MSLLLEWGIMIPTENNNGSLTFLAHFALKPGSEDLDLSNRKVPVRPILKKSTFSCDSAN